MDKRQRAGIKASAESITQGESIVRPVFLHKTVVLELLALVDKYESALKAVLLQTQLARIFGNANVTELVSATVEKALEDLLK